MGVSGRASRRDRRGGLPRLTRPAYPNVSRMSVADDRAPHTHHARGRLTEASATAQAVPCQARRSLPASSAFPRCEEAGGARAALTDGRGILVLAHAVAGSPQRVVDQHRDVACTAVGDSKIRLTVGIEIAHGNGHGPSPYPEGQRSLEGAITVAQ